mmetsp:Transcript_17554/g.26297  ORF Transcript_17554/g.26297 Transcript_17554/m.26297 type:complete len:92 (-) Transcript_17554:289-564(-)
MEMHDFWGHIYHGYEAAKAGSEPNFHLLRSKLIVSNTKTCYWLKSYRHQAVASWTKNLLRESSLNPSSPKKSYSMVEETSPFRTILRAGEY